MCRHRLLKLLIRVQHSSELLIKVNICPRLEDNPSLLRDAGVEYSLLSPDLPATQHSSLRWKQYPHRNYPLVKQQTGIIDFLTRQNILYNMMRCLIRILYFPNVHYIFLIFFLIYLHGNVMWNSRYFQDCYQGIVLKDFNQLWQLCSLAVVYSWLSMARYWKPLSSEKLSWKVLRQLID